MSLKIGINGFGRIGKLVFRYSEPEPQMEVTHINDKMGIDLIRHLLKYDSIHGQFEGTVKIEDNYLIINDRKILVTNYAEPSEIPWQKSEVQYIVDSSGKFKTSQKLEGHLRGGVKKVILSSPAEKNQIDRTVVLGVNQKEIQSNDKFISNASCTTNCVSIVLKVLLDEFGIERAFLNTVHPFTNNQNLQDGFHKDFRRARSAYNNIIPTTTSAIDTTSIVIPELRGKFDGFATRVPVADCSFVEINAQMSKKTSIYEINEAYRFHSENHLKGILEYCEEPIVSSDVTNNRHSAIFDALATKIIGGDFVQLLAWYDNESGYSSRIIDLIKFLAK